MPESDHYDTSDGCQWLVERARVIVETPEMLADPDYEPWYPDFPSDCYEVAPCGDEVEPNDRGPFCRYHLVPMTMDLSEFETRVDAGESWSR